MHEKIIKNCSYRYKHINHYIQMFESSRSRWNSVIINITTHRQKDRKTDKYASKYWRGERKNRKSSRNVGPFDSAL